MKEQMLLIFEIERFALHDGPGIRTVVFFQGCPLKCEWCANPESQSFGKHIMMFSGRCTGCGMCMKCCPEEAISLKEGKALINRSVCCKCGKCEEVCNNNAVKVSGETISCDELFQIIIRDREYYAESGGGLTLSGGEALLQIEQLMPLLIECKRNGIDIAVETTGYVALDKIILSNSIIDLFLFDIKSLNAEKLRKHTGGDLSVILSAFERISSLNPEKVILRIPVIPNFNNTEKEISNIMTLALNHHIKEVNLLPYHTFGISKYAQLGRPYQFESKTSLREHDLIEMKKSGEKMGLVVKIVG